MKILSILILLFYGQYLNSRVISNTWSPFEVQKPLSKKLLKEPSPCAHSEMPENFGTHGLWTFLFQIETFNPLY